jgi:hypothetical protein
MRQERPGPGRLLARSTNHHAPRLPHFMAPCAFRPFLEKLTVVQLVKYAQYFMVQEG